MFGVIIYSVCTVIFSQSNTLFNFVLKRRFPNQTRLNIHLTLHILCSVIRRKTHIRIRAGCRFHDLLTMLYAKTYMHKLFPIP